MSTIITALLIVISTVGIPLIFISTNKKKNKGRNGRSLKLFSQEGTRQGLSFSSQEVLRNKIIGLDGIKQMLLVFDPENTANVICIPLEEVKNCTVEKRYDSIVIGSEKNRKIEPHLRSIDLEFTFKNNREPVQISFYDSRVNSIYEMSELEARAKTWEAALGKMIFKEQEVRA